jgi:hypothetical protein
MPQNRNSIHCPYQGKKDKKDNESFSFPCMCQRLMRVSYEKLGIGCCFSFPCMCQRLMSVSYGECMGFAVEPLHLKVLNILYNLHYK